MRNDFIPRNVAAVCAVLLLVLSTALWYVVHEAAAIDSATWGVITWYGSYVALIVLVTLLSWRMDNTPQQRLIPRLHLLATFLLWLLTLMGISLGSNVITVYFLHLLVAPILLLLLTLVALRIVHTFAPTVQLYWFYVLSWCFGLLAIILVPSRLNQNFAPIGGEAVFTPGVGYTVCIGLGFLLVLISIVLIPFGRRHYRKQPTYSVGPLVFSTPAKPIDVHFVEMIARIVHTYRKVAIKRGQWVRYHNHIHSDHTIIATQPKSCTNLITTLTEYALHKNQTKALAVELFEDTHHPYLHCCISYTVNKQAALEFSTYAKHATDLGGHLTVNRNQRETTLILSFPRQW